MSDTARRTPIYVLGSSAAEQQRLLDQAARLSLITERLLRDAGIASGMRVLDLGCGPGDVTMLAAELVGPSGEVTGIDKEATALATARARAAERQLANVRFIEHDLLDLNASTFDRPFDALIGRCILNHLPDPAAVLRAARRHIRPGGIVAFQEPDITLTELTIGRSRSALLRQVQEWFARGLLAAGRDLLHANFDFPAIFRRAGLPTPRILCHTELGVGADAFLPAQLTQFLRSLLPLFEQLGVVSAAEAEIDTLEARLRAELAVADPEAVLAAWSFVDLWAVNPA